jgi:hypothetical protein
MNLRRTLSAVPTLIGEQTCKWHFLQAIVCIQVLTIIGYINAQTTHTKGTNNTDLVCGIPKHHKPQCAIFILSSPISRHTLLPRCCRTRLHNPRLCSASGSSSRKEISILFISSLVGFISHRLIALGLGGDQTLAFLPLGLLVRLCKLARRAATGAETIGASIALQSVLVTQISSSNHLEDPW